MTWLINKLFKSEQQYIEEYLAKSVDRVDLESRMHKVYKF